MKPTTKIYGDISLTIQQQCGWINRCAWWNLAIVVKSIESWTVSGFSDLKFLFVLQKFKANIGILRENELVNTEIIEFVWNILAYVLLQVVYVFLAVKSPHFLFACVTGMVNVKFSEFQEKYL